MNESETRAEYIDPKLKETRETRYRLLLLSESNLTSENCIQYLEKVNEITAINFVRISNKFAEKTENMYRYRENMYRLVYFCIV